MKIFYKDNNNRIYKKMKDYYLLYTPWEKGEDRRKYPHELESLTPLHTEAANQQINEIWRNTEWEWEFEGKKYKATSDNFNLGKTYEFKHEHSSLDGEKRFSYTDAYRLRCHRGKLVWVLHDVGYSPRMMLYEFTSISQEPTKFIGWTNAHNLKRIHCVTDNESL